MPFVLLLMAWGFLLHRSDPFSINFK